MNSLSAVVDCGNLGDPFMGEVNMEEGSSLGSRASYSCYEGYVISGAMSRVCQDNGRWSREEPICARELYIPRSCVVMQVA